MLSTLKSFATALRAPLIAVAALCGVTGALPAAAQFTLGKDYVVLQQPQSTSDDGKIEVLEFFAYGCPHCGALEPALAEWVKKQGPDVVVKRVPAAMPGFNLRGIESAPLYYTLEAMGQINKLHEKIFDAANRDGVALGSMADQTKWLAKQGIDAGAFEATRKSFSVDSKIKSAVKLGETYRITSTPTMIVGGKFSASQTQGPTHLLAVIDMLVGQVRSTMKKPVSSVVPAGAAVAAVGAAGAVVAAKAVTKPKVVKPKVVAKPAVATPVTTPVASPVTTPVAASAAK
jgi:protein dithiol oxidoreductase (disulfide-forming)